MTRHAPGPVPFHSTLYALLGIGAIYLALVPVSPAGGYIFPDLLYCLSIVWVLRMPDSAPVLLILILGLFADTLLSRPIGLGTLGLLLATETARRHRPVLTGSGLLPEWLASAIGYALLLVLADVVMRLTFLTVPPASDLLRLWLGTTLSYPVVAVALGWLPRSAGAPDSRGFGP